MSSSPNVPSAVPPPDPRRWLALAVIGVAQLMAILDMSIVNIALPSAQADLKISLADRQWVVTAYTLAFGALLLLGGRIADFVGRKRAFVVGLVGFALASALGGAAQNPGWLFGARGVQGAFAALMVPAALSLITVTFTESKERAKAFAVYGGVSGAGAAVGLLLGGVLTEYASWRWTLLVNTPIALLTALAAIPLVQESRRAGTSRYDVPGVITSALGLMGLVYGFTKAKESGWTAGSTIGLLAAGVILLGVFFGIESRTADPLLPSRVFTERSRSGAQLGSLLAGLSIASTFLFLAYYMQGTLHYSALKTGLAFLPITAGFLFATTMAGPLLPKFGPRALMTGGFALGAVGMAWFAHLNLDSDYLTNPLPAMIAMSAGLGFAMVATSSTALTGVDPSDAGVASALVNTTRQVGGSLGVALLNTLAATATTRYITDHGVASTAAGEVHGYGVAFIWGSGALALAAALSFLLVASPDVARPAGAEGGETPFTHETELGYSI